MPLKSWIPPSLRKQVPAAGAIVATLMLVTLQPAMAALREPKAVPSGLALEMTQKLTEERDVLVGRLRDLKARDAAQKTRCGSVPDDDTAMVASCTSEKEEIEDQEWRYIEDTRDFEGPFVIYSLNGLASEFNWSAKERDHLDRALRKLEGVEHGNVSQVQQAWRDVLLRGDAGALAADAAAGQGPGFLGAGQQTIFQDCTIFALANATGRPYGWVAGQAGDLIRKASYRDIADRLDPQNVLERSGLNGGEVIMLAEAFGWVEVVAVADFERVLGNGSPIMIDVVPPGGAGEHEVVLTKSFQHGGERWFEVMDSNQGPLRRLYFRAAELESVLLENGVAYHADPGTVPSLLR